MTVFATNLTAGRYTYPGADFGPNERREVPLDIAIALYNNRDFRLEFEGNENLSFRNEIGKPSYLGFVGAISNRIGYGYGGISILRALHRKGVQVSRQAVLGQQYDGTYPELEAQLQQRKWLPKIDLLHGTPEFLKYATAPTTVMWTMWETTQIPKGTNHQFHGDWAEQINAGAQHLVVPTAFSKAVFENSGVTRPISVIPYGIDVDEWPFMDRPEDRSTFTFFQWGDLSMRKGPYEALQAFQLAFPREDDVRLVFKTWGNKFGVTTIPTIRDTRIEIINQRWTHEQLVNGLYKADALVWPSRGEGFGLPPLQAALTGLPVITTTHTGMEAYYDARYMYGVNAPTMSEATIGGMWYEPDVEHLASQMRLVYEKRKDAKRKAKAGATFYRKRFNLDVLGDNLMKFLETL